MGRTRPVLRQSLKVGPGAIASMSSKPIVRVRFVQPVHLLIAGGLGKN
jgi:hypothetical protein